MRLTPTCHYLGSWESRRIRVHKCHTCVQPHRADKYTDQSHDRSCCSVTHLQNTGRLRKTHSTLQELVCLTYLKTYYTSDTYVYSWGNHSNQEHTGHMTLHCNWAGSGSDPTQCSWCPMRCLGHRCTLRKQEVRHHVCNCRRPYSWQSPVPAVFILKLYCENLQLHKI